MTLKSPFLFFAILFLPFQLRGQTLISRYLNESRYQNNNFLVKGEYYSKTKNYGWVCGDYGTIQYTVDGGRNWITSTHVPTDVYINCIYFSPDNLNGWAAGNNGIILRSKDGGKSWENIYHEATWNNIESISFSSDNKYGIILTNQNEIFQTYNGGVNWRGYSYNVENKLLRVKFINDKYGFILASASLLVTYDQGKKWTDLIVDELSDQINDLDKSVFSAFDVTDNKCFVGTDSGTIFTIGLGKNANLISHTKTPMLKCRINNISMVDAKTGWLAADTTLLCKTEDGGRNWKVAFSLKNKFLTIKKMHFFDSRNGCFFIVDYGRRLSTTDGGITFYGDTLSRDDSHRFIKFRNQTFIFTSNSFRSEKNNSPPILQIPYTSPSMRFAYCNDEDHIWLTGDSGKIYYSSGQRKFKGSQIGHSKITGLCFDKTNKTGWLITYEGKLYNTLDGGAKWTNHDFDKKDSLNAIVVNESLTKCFIVGNHGMLWISTSPNGPWMSKYPLSDGNNFNFSNIIFDKDFNNGFIIVQPQKKHGQLVKTGSFLLKTTNGGESWHAIKKFDRINEFTNLIFGKDRLWLLTTDGNILESLDNGENWFQISPRLTYYSLFDLLEQNGEVKVIGNNGYFKTLKKDNRVFDIIKFELVSQNNHQIPKLQLNKGKLDSVNLVVSIVAINGSQKLTRSFLLNDLPQIYWSNDDLEYNKKYRFLISVSDGITAKSKTF
jgi:photosystem II stability/assembly factor-like uncharacterized protein